MEITWHGERCFTIKGKDTTIVIDPYEKSDHILEEVKADTVLLTGDYDGTAVLRKGADKAKKVNWPGEYEIQGVAIVAIPSYSKQVLENDKTGGKIILFSFIVDGIRMCHLGTLGGEVDEETMEKIGNVDVLMVPAAGKEALDSKKAHEIIEAIDPRIVIPMNYKGSEVDVLLKQLGITDPRKEEKLTISGKAQLPEEKTEFVLLDVSP
ncbi:MBL fold metallo-hydrolase [bacterium]|nr:MBL fold metallo-hydrolase [bacterium]